MRQKSIFECCGRIGHKADACIIRDHKLLPPSHIINMNQFNDLHGEEQNKPQRKCNRKPTAAHFKYRTSSPNTTPVVSSIMGILNNHAIDNGDVKVTPSEFPVEFNS